MSNLDNVKVPLLADDSAEDLKMELAAAGEVISAAQANSLAAIVGTHNETGKKGVILCGMVLQDNGLASYTPLAMLFTEDFQAWTEYTPPKCAMEPAPLDNLEEDSEQMELFDETDEEAAEGVEETENDDESEEDRTSAAS